MIRKYQEKDESRLITLFKQNTPEYFAPSEEVDFRNYLKKYAQHHYVYTEGEQVLGCAGYSWQEEKGQGMVAWFVVDPKQQGKGIGQALLHYAIAELRKIPAVKTIVVRTSQLVYQFFEKSGFVLRSTEKDYWAPGFDLYYMELPSSGNYR